MIADNKLTVSNGEQMNVSEQVDIQESNGSLETKPDFSLVFYKSSTEVRFITRHGFKGNIMQEGEIINEDDLIKALSSKKGKTDKQDNVLINASLLLDNSNHLMWHSPSRNHSMWFRLNGKKPFRLVVEWTSLMFYVNKKTRVLRVFALENNDRPTLDSNLYWCPLSNVYYDHRLCQGSAPLPSKIDGTTITEIENTLYDSAFDGFKHTHLFKSKKDNEAGGVAFWENKAKNNSSVDVKNELNVFATLEDVLNNLDTSNYFRP